MVGDGAEEGGERLVFHGLSPVGGGIAQGRKRRLILGTERTGRPLFSEKSGLEARAPNAADGRANLS